MIELFDVSKSVAGRPVIASATLVVPPGRCLCLAGPSGCGKTTLLEIAAGLVRPDRGRVRLGSPRVGYLFQDDVLVPWLGARGNIAYVLDGPARERRRVAGEWAERFGLPPSVPPPSMSGGMRRRLNLARTFATRPDVLLLDEPFAFLDDHWQEVLLAETAAAMERGAAVLLVTHQTRPLAGLDCDLLELDRDPDGGPVRIAHGVGGGANRGPGSVPGGSARNGDATRAAPLPGPLSGEPSVRPASHPASHPGPRLPGRLANRLLTLFCRY
ncbi:MAG: ATP-binding cassette domain-containing protein [Desulfovibrionaceae bacterium]|jgi:NitT/TauT family transport system ATP-binding protein|nr:ATP-binding cassette domain-containing protein [Desulfovibrionaceae bacterium]